jgi:hypothetical protein
MENSSKIKKTVTKKLLYVGGAIWEGQNIKGVERTPNIIRNANLFKTLNEKYEVDSIDLGDISAENYK